MGLEWVSPGWVGPVGGLVLALALTVSLFRLLRDGALLPGSTLDRIEAQWKAQLDAERAIRAELVKQHDQERQAGQEREAQLWAAAGRWQETATIAAEQVRALMAYADTTARVVQALGTLSERAAADDDGSLD